MFKTKPNLHGLNARKKYGQNFLQNDRVINSIIEECKDCSDILEIGSGMGALTIPLSQKEHLNFTIIEIDSDLSAYLQSELGRNTLNDVKVENADFLRYDLTKINLTNGCVVSSLPYNVASPILHRLINEFYGRWKKGIFIIQKEVADKIMSIVPQATYWSNYITYYYEVKLLISKIPPDAFYPQPNVNSSVIVFNLREQDLLILPKKWSDFLHMIFTFPRKMIRNTIPVIDSIDPSLATKRPGELKLEELTRIYDYLMVVPFNKNKHQQA